ncbi:hypothetical protein PROVRETT_06021 [Providencia rettgeri DSM 1131]|uniref:hypothetical protein n=1 Tax=Providencia rettgeri TaxID=587 RepID=UPI000197CA1B|nr:hypothetical protein [Providencia rettgeri]EFE55312.1 hypothetical protein PROVRETT_06021 [Providencia rettgeri DSM 1131]QXA59643.1 hypothetical protein I6L79_09135 [Providencia rettgeri]
MTIEERLEKLESSVKLLSMKQINKELEDNELEIKKLEKQISNLKSINENHLATIHKGAYL